MPPAIDHALRLRQRWLTYLLAILLITWTASNPTTAGRWRWWRRTHFWLSAVYTVTNVPHLIADIVVPDSRSDQVFLMVVLLVIGLLINVEGWRWWRQPSSAWGIVLHRPAPAQTIFWSQGSRKLNGRAMVAENPSRPRS